ncbi:MAG: heme ABC transporter ATP-binding protein/permease CydC [Symbiopectobacterium sp.]
MLQNTLLQVLKPFLLLYRRHIFRLSIGVVLDIATLLASIGLLTLSGWFLAGASLAGLAGLMTFNYMLPAAGVRGAAILRTAGRYAERLVSHDATFRVLKHLRVFTFSRILPLSPGGLARFRQVDLLNRLVADVDTLDHLYLRVISPFISALVVILVVTYGLSWIYASLALTLGTIMLLLLAFLPPVLYRAGKPIGTHLTLLRSRYHTQLTTWLQGQAELTLFSAQTSFRHLSDTEQTWLTQQQRQSRLTGLSQALMLLCTGVTITTILWLAAAGIGGDTQSGALIALFVFAALAAFEALGPVTRAFQHLGQVIESATRVDQILRQKPVVVFTTAAPSATSTTTATLSLQQVSFTYPGQPLPVLQDITLDIAPGEHIALLGCTGSGKSTLLQLLTRAWDCDAGSITLNDLPLAHWSEPALRDMMGVLPQRIHIFSATLRDNLLLAAPQASDAQLSQQLEQVELGNLLETPEGLNALIGEGGRQLSGGEQCRLGVARALLHPAPLVLLDEPTEGLDADTEQKILHLLRENTQGKTVIIITHRLHDLAYLDRICVLDNGRLVEQGHHADLLAARGRYWQFHQHTIRQA